MTDKDKKKFVLYLKQKKKDNIKSDMFGVVNKYAIDNTKSIKDIKSRIKEINKINDEIGNSIRDLKRLEIDVNDPVKMIDFALKYQAIIRYKYADAMLATRG